MATMTLDELLKPMPHLAGELSKAKDEKKDLEIKEERLSSELKDAQKMLRSVLSSRETIKDGDASSVGGSEPDKESTPEIPRTEDKPKKTRGRKTNRKLPKEQTVDELQEELNNLIIFRRKCRKTLGVDELRNIRKEAKRLRHAILRKPKPEISTEKGEASGVRDAPELDKEYDQDLKQMRADYDQKMAKREQELAAEYTKRLQYELEIKLAERDAEWEKKLQQQKIESQKQKKIMFDTIDQIKLYLEQ